MRVARAASVLLLAGVLVASGLRSSADDTAKPKSAKELAQGFVYPGAERFGEEREGARLYQAKFTTADDAGKVAGWYAKAVGFEVGSEGIAFNPGQQPGVRVSVADDSRQPGKDASATGEARPLYLKVFVKKVNDAVVVAVVSRGKDEPRTHVALTWLDNKDQ
jgi:hypothetical protein